MAAPTNPLGTALAALLGELVDGPPAAGGYMLNRGDAGLLRQRPAEGHVVAGEAQGAHDRPEVGGDEVGALGRQDGKAEVGQPGRQPSTVRARGPVTTRVLTAQVMVALQEGFPQLALALWLEADRMGTLLDAPTQDNLDNQREVVKEEKRQRYDNVPYGDVMERLVALTFPPGHPYAHTTIGSMADLDAALALTFPRRFPKDGVEPCDNPAETAPAPLAEAGVRR